MPTIGSLTYRLIAKTDEFKQGLIATSKELRQQKQLFLSTRTPVEAYNSALRQLEHAYKSGKLSADVYHRSLARLKMEFAATQGAGVRLADFFPRLASMMTPVGIALAAMAANVRIVRSEMQLLQLAISRISERFEELDKIAKTSAALNIAESSLIGLRMAAEDFSGVEATQLDASLLRMTRRIAEAARGTGEAQEAMKLLELDAKHLASVRTDQAFLAIANAMQKIDSPSTRALVAYQLLGREGVRLVTTLGSTREELLRMIELSNKLSQTKFVDFKGIEEANDAMGRLNMLVSGLFNVIASDLAPLVEMIADDLTKSFTDSTTAGSKFRMVIRDTALTMAAMADIVSFAIGVYEKFDTVINFLVKRFLSLNPLLGAQIALLDLVGASADRLEKRPGTFTARLTKEFAKPLAAVPERSAISEAQKMFDEIERRRESNELFLTQHFVDRSARTAEESLKISLKELDVLKKIEQKIASREGPELLDAAGA